MRTLTAGDRQAIIDTAARLGVDPAHLTAIMQFESAGTMNPDVVGGTKNRYQGLIQFGAPERAAYGYRRGMTIADQVRGPVYNFLHSRGAKPGMGIKELYNLINPGGRKYVPQIKGLLPKAQAMIGPVPPMNVGQTAQGKQMPIGPGRGQIRSGPAVRQLQERLNAAGFKVAVDGTYGPKTAAAVRQAEATFGLNRDKGVAGPQVLGALASQSATNNIRSLPPAGGAPAVDPMSPEAYAFGLSPQPAGGMGAPPPMGTGLSDPPPNPLNAGPRFSTASRVPTAPMSDPSMGAAPAAVASTPYGGRRGRTDASRFSPAAAQAAMASIAAAHEPSSGPDYSNFGGHGSVGVGLGRVATGRMSADLTPAPAGTAETSSPWLDRSLWKVAGGLGVQPSATPGGFSQPRHPSSAPQSQGDSLAEFGGQLGNAIAGAAGAAGNAVGSAGAAVFGPGGPVQSAGGYLRQQMGLDPTPAAGGMPTVNPAYRAPAVLPGNQGPELVGQPPQWPGGALPMVASVDPQRRRTFELNQTDAQRLDPSARQELSDFRSNLAATNKLYAPGYEYNDNMNWLSGLNRASVNRDALYSLHAPSANVEDRRGAAVHPLMSSPSMGPQTSSGVQYAVPGVPGAIPAGGQPAPWGSFDGQVIGTMPDLAGNPALSFGPSMPAGSAPRPPSLDVSVRGSPTDRARTALSDAMRASVVSGAGQSSGNFGGGAGGGYGYGISPAQQTQGWINNYFGSQGVSPGRFGTYGSPWTPSGYTPASYNPISGGATYAYQPNGQGGGTYVDSSGNVHTY